MWQTDRYSTFNYTSLGFFKFIAALDQKNCTFVVVYFSA